MGSCCVVLLREEWCTCPARPAAAQLLNTGLGSSVLKPSGANHACGLAVCSAVLCQTLGFPPKSSGGVFSPLVLGLCLANSLLCLPSFLAFFQFNHYSISFYPVCRIHSGMQFGLMLAALPVSSPITCCRSQCDRHTRPPWAPVSCPGISVQLGGGLPSASVGLLLVSF